MMERAKGDRTYCTSNECERVMNCKRSCVHYEFDNDNYYNNYSFVDKCENFELYIEREV
jgi:hypothetical protein